MIRICLFFSFFINLVSVLASPLDSIGITNLNGKVYINYLVEAGETVYKISTRYGVPVSDLLEENPELEKGLKTGMVINIPYHPEKRNYAEEDAGTKYYTVEKGDTYFSISKKHNIPLADLLKLNNIELKTGQKIVVGKASDPIAQKQPEVDQNNLEFNNTEKTPAEKPKSEKSITKNENNPVPVKALAAPKTDSVAIGNNAPEYDNNVKKVIIIPFDPYLYFSDADDEIAEVSKMNRTKVRQAFRRRLNAYLEPKGYETIHLLGGTTKDSTTDLNRAYSSISYTYDNVMMTGLHIEKPDLQKSHGNIKLPVKKTEVSPNGAMLQSRSTLAKDEGKYFAVRIKDPNFFPFFNTKYQADYYIFISQFEIKTNYENCLDRARQNYERTFITHFSIFEKSGKQISGGRLKSTYESNNNHLEKILADNIPTMANQIMAELPK